MLRLMGVSAPSLHRESTDSLICLYLHYNVLSSVFQEVKGKIMCLCTRSEDNLFACKISSLVLLQLLSYTSS